MIDTVALHAAFPELSDICALPIRSGQKDVFAANHSTGKVALKIIKRGLADLPRTQREIEAVSKLQSSFVPSILFTGGRKVSNDDVLFIIEQFIEGTSYRQKLCGNPVQDLRSVLPLLLALLCACDDFERARIVHRDIKPENLIIDTNHKVWVVDFGIARHLDLQSLTGDSPYRGVGTVGYAAPEQFQNIKAQINVRADLFAVGTMIYEALAGHNPFLRGLHTVHAVIQRMETESVPLLECSEDTSGLLPKFLNSLMQRFPSRRPQSAKEALAWFEPIRQYYGISG
jgi:eukaryotic-like serine/threonine-protein kinase